MDSNALGIICQAMPVMLACSQKDLRQMKVRIIALVAAVVQAILLETRSLELQKTEGRLNS